MKYFAIIFVAFAFGCAYAGAQGTTEQPPCSCPACIIGQCKPIACPDIKCAATATSVSSAPVQTSPPATVTAASGCHCPACNRCPTCPPTNCWLRSTRASYRYHASNVEVLELKLTFSIVNYFTDNKITDSVKLRFWFPISVPKVSKNRLFSVCLPHHASHQKTRLELILCSWSLMWLGIICRMNHKIKRMRVKDAWYVSIKVRVLKLEHSKLRSPRNLQPLPTRHAQFQPLC